MPLKLLVIDDHPLVQEGVAAALEALGHDVHIVAARDADQGLVQAAAHPDIDLVLVDLALPGMSGFAVIRKLHERLPSLPVVVLSALDDTPNRQRAIDAGAIGFVPKSASTRALIDMMKQVLAGRVPDPLPARIGATSIIERDAAERTVPPLTQRQVDVLARVCQGKTNKQIASELGLSEKTVKAHVTAIFKILNVVNRTQAVLVARKLGLVTH